MASSPGEAIWQHVQRVHHLDPNQMLSDSELVNRFCQTRDESIFRTIFDRHARRIWAYCRQRLGKTSDSEDAFQAVFLLFVQKAHTIRNPESLSSWFGGVIRKISGKLLRNSKRESSHSQIDERSRSATDPIPNDWHPLLAAAIRELPEHFREPLALCELNGFTRTDVAKMLNISENTLSSRLARAKSKLRERLQGTGLELPALGMIAFIPDAISARTIESIRTFLANPEQLRPHLSPQVLSILEGASTTMMTKWILTVGTMLIGATALLVFGQVPNPAQLPPTQKKLIPEKDPNAKIDPNPANPRTNRIEELQKDRLKAAEEWLKGASLKLNFGNGSVLEVREAWVAVTRSRLALANSQEERLRIYKEQLDAFTEWEKLAKELFKQGRISQHEASQSTFHRIEVELELETFRAQSTKK